MAAKKTNSAEEKKARSLKDLDFKQMGKDYKKPVLIVVGMAAGAIGTKQLLKIIEKNTPVSGLLGIDKDKLKKYIAPGVGIATGLVVHQFVKNPSIKMVAIGTAVNSTVLFANQLLDKNILAGLGVAEESTSNRNAPPPIEQYAEESLEPLAIPLYEIEEPQALTTNYIDSVMSEMEREEPRQEVESIPIPEEKEVILSSDRPEDNFEPEREVKEDSPEMSGTLESIVLEPEPQRIIQYEREYEEELDFSNIP